MKIISVRTQPEYAQTAIQYFHHIEEVKKQLK
jgi:hypothetical protein